MMWGIGRLGYGALHAAPWLAWAGPVAMIVFWALVIAAIAFFIRFVVRQAGSGRPGGSAEEILKQRYAKGEIGREEYVEKMKDLG